MPKPRTGPSRRGADLTRTAANRLRLLCRVRVFGEGRGVSEWTKGSGPGFGWPGVGEGVLPPSSPRALEKLLAPLAEARGAPHRGHRERPEAYERVFESRQVPSTFFFPLQSQGRLWAAISSSPHHPCSSWCPIGTAWGLGRAFSRKLGLFRGLAPQNWFHQEWRPP